MKYNELKDCMLVKHLIEDIDSNAGWLCFFLMFSRFEYALKRSGYAKMNRYNNLEIEWGRFGQEAKEAFATHDSDELREAIKYLKDNPPKKQILNSEGNLDWRSPDGINEDIKSLIDAVKRVRNNLFHGGKYPSGPVSDPSRNRELIKHSITVLKYLLYSSHQVKEHYFEPLEQKP